MMTFEEYQKKSKTTAVYPNVGNNVTYPALGLGGETGEVLEKIKKVIRDSDGKFDHNTKPGIAKEIGDVLWYAAQLCNELGLDMGLIAQQNLEKLISRKNRNKLHGMGDNR